jgi:hypothetical protein
MDDLVYQIMALASDKTLNGYGLIAALYLLWRRYQDRKLPKTK